MATKNSKNGNGNEATSKKFDYKELLAKALGTTPNKIQTIDEMVSDSDILFKKAQEAVNEKYSKVESKPVGYYDKPKNRTASQILDEAEVEILENEISDEAEEVEIIEIAPVAGKKVIAQNSAQAKKLLSQAKPKEAAKPKSFSEMTDEEKVARRKEISAKALAAKRAKKAQDEATETANKTRTRTSANKPDAVSDLINMGKEKEHRTQLNELLIRHKGMSLVKVEENTGHLNDDEVVDLISKLKEEKVAPVSKPTSKPEKKMQRTTGNPSKTPLSKMTMAELQEVKGTISDVQWNKYFKIAAKRDGVELTQVAPKSKSAAESKTVEEKKAPVTRTRTAPVEKEKASNANEELCQLAYELYIAFKRFEAFMDRNR